MRRLLPLGIALGLLAAACAATDSTPTAVPATPTPTETAERSTSGNSREDAAAPQFRLVRMPPDLDEVPPLDLSRSTVDPAGVVYDTFDGSFVTVTDAEPHLARELRDLIAPIYLPVYEEGVVASEWLADDQRVIGFEFEGKSYAYPTRTLMFREIVNETFGDLPVAVTFCPLCASGVVFDRRLDGEELLFGNTSALYDQDLVMYDHQTGTYWHQTSGKAIVGALAGRRLDFLPSLVTTFGEWRDLHPSTVVLSTSKQIPTRGDVTSRVQESADRGEFFFPVSDAAKSDDRLNLGAKTLMVRLAGQAKAYGLMDVLGTPANDRIGDIPVAVFASQTESMAAYVARVDDRELTFDKGDDGLFVDRQTGSEWDLAGRSVSGALEGEQLTLIPASAALWFSIAGSNPDVPLYQP